MYGDFAVTFGCWGAAVPRNSTATTRMTARARTRFNMGHLLDSGSVALAGRRRARAVDDGALRPREIATVAAQDPLEHLAAAVGAAARDRGADGIVRERRRVGGVGRRRGVGHRGAEEQGRDDEDARQHE